MNIPTNSNVAATYTTSAVPASQTRPVGTASSVAGSSSTSTGSDSRTAAAKDAGRTRLDTLELSTQGLRLALTQGGEASAAEEPAPPPPSREAKTAEDAEYPPLLGAKESNWQSERKSKLDRLETLVRQGQYKVDPFILDELAVRMARLMN